MTTVVHHAELVEDLTRLATGEFTGADFLSKYQSSRSPVLDAIWDNLHHYVADADIRAKDPEYGKMQDDELVRLIGLIQETALYPELGRVTFLGRSE